MPEYIAKRPATSEPLRPVRTESVQEKQLESQRISLPVTGLDAVGSASAKCKAVMPNSAQGQRVFLSLQRKYGNRIVQRALSLGRNAEVQSEVESKIEQLRGGGSALQSGLRLQMESAFGADFKGVRIHTGAEADALNRAVNATAFTTGKDIFFSAGAYDARSSEGRELLAHELTHVVQQGEASVTPGNNTMRVQRLCPACEEKHEDKLQAKLALSQPEDADEVEAERIGKSVASALNTSATESHNGDLYTSHSPESAMLRVGLQAARDENDERAAALLQRSLDFAAANPSLPRSITSGRCSCEGGCPKCAGEKLVARGRGPCISKAPGRLARDGNSGGKRTTLQCINAMLSNAGIPWAVLAILGGVCGIIGAVATSPTGPGAAAGGVGAAALCIAGVTGLTVGMVTGIITRCIQDPSVDWVFAQNEPGASTSPGTPSATASVAGGSGSGGQVSA